MSVHPLTKSISNNTTPLLAVPARSGARRYPGERGFSLIEILVVLISAVALMSFGLLGGDDRDLRQEARRLSSLIQVVNDDAGMQGRDFGLELMLAGYRWVEHDPYVDQWFEVTDDDIMYARQLAEGTEFELYVEEHRVLLEEEAKVTETDEEASDRDLTEDYLPHVLILSSGDITPFELRLVRLTDRSEVTLTMSLAGEMEIKDADQAEL